MKRTTFRKWDAIPKTQYGPTAKGKRIVAFIDACERSKFEPMQLIEIIVNTYALSNQVVFVSLQDAVKHMHQPVGPEYSAADYARYKK